MRGRRSVKSLAPSHTPSRATKTRLTDALATFTATPRSSDRPTVTSLCRLAAVSRNTLYPSDILIRISDEPNQKPIGIDVDPSEFLAGEVEFFFPRCQHVASSVWISKLNPAIHLVPAIFTMNQNYVYFMN